MLKVKRDFFCTCTQPLNLKVIISMKHVTQSAWLPISMEETEESLHCLTWVWLSGKWMLCLLSAWVVDVLFSIYNWKSWKSVARIKSLGQRKFVGFFFFPFWSCPSDSEVYKGFQFVLLLLLSPHHCFLPSKTSAHIHPAQSWIVALTDSDMSLSQGRA